MDFRSPDDIDAERAQKRANIQKNSSHHSAHKSHRSHVRNNHQQVFAHSNKLSPSSSYDDSKCDLSAIKLEPELMLDDELALDMLMSPSKYETEIDASAYVKDEDDYDDDDDDQLPLDTTVRKSAYMSEKSSKKKIYKDGEIILSRQQRKDKGKARFTAYMLWSKEARDEMLKSNPDLDFATTSRRLSQMWANVSTNDKYIWRRRAKRVTLKNKRALKTGEKLTTNYLNRPGRKPGRKPKNMLKNSITSATNTKSKSAVNSKSKNDRHSNSNSKNGQSAKGANGIHKDVVNSNLSKSNSSAIVKPGAYKTSPIEVAAHLKLLGDSLTIIGQRLKEHEVCRNTYAMNSFNFIQILFLFYFYFRAK